MSKEINKRSFWKRPEGVTGRIFLFGIIGGLGYFLYLIGPALGTILASTLNLAILFTLIGGLLYIILDPKMRNLVWYMYKSVMRWITSQFVRIDPIGILKSYVSSLENNLKAMERQINQLKAQKHQLYEVIHNNKKAIENNLYLASEAKASNKKDIMILKSRKAGRLRESNIKLEDLHKKMETLHRVLKKMYESSFILKEDLKDQIAVKEQERKAIHASHGAMKSAMSIISGDPDKRAMFDMAMEAVADDVSQKVGEMERFMDMSSNFMNSMDLKNGIFEEEGLKMLEEWEQESSLLLGEEKLDLLSKDDDVLDLDEPIKKPIRDTRHRNQYDSFFDFEE